MALDQAYWLQAKLWQVGLTITNTTLAKILVDETAAQVLAAVTNEVALPGEAAVRQRVLSGGCRIIGGAIASTDGTARSVILWNGRKLSTLAAGVHTITATNVLTRGDAASFITDGWLPGDAVMMFGTGVAADEGVPAAVVTAVAALTLTVSGAPWTNSAGLAANTRVFRVTQRTRKAIAISAGNLDATPPVALLIGRAGDSQFPEIAALPDGGISLGALDVMLASMAANVSALPAQIAITAETILY